MIDHRTYREMDENATAFTFDKPKSLYSNDTLPNYVNYKDEISPKVLILLSSTIHGFDLSEGEWVHLRLDSIHPVSWNKAAYDRLTLPEASKDLMRTLVLAQKIQPGAAQGSDVARTRTNIMERKGNVLSILLHGGPGTGKTLTAESLAEIAELPLYRVNCGDVGTNAATIEKDFAFVLGLGKAWNCVLLLEEAHTLLEKRSLSDPKKDGLVSSFLRILENYNGIVVLTSRRVDGFDEMLISRIQVVVNCEQLSHSSRKKIWGNFIDIFEEDDGNANFGGIRLHLDDLAAKNLNGHQICNVFKTAKEVAMFREERLVWDHLEQALSLSSGSISI
jgi:hypothetical protein